MKNSCQKESESSNDGQFYNNLQPKLVFKNTHIISYF